MILRAWLGPWWEGWAPEHAVRAFRGMGGDVVEDCIEVGEGGKRVAKLHKPCSAQVARTCSSVANSPHAAAAFEAAMAARSSDESATGAACSSCPASRRTRRAMSSCTEGDRLRAAASA